MKLQISRELSLPLDAVTQTFTILAKRRVGKTYTASVMAEEMVKAGLPFVALDPTGAWWGLRASSDSKSEGYPVTIIGGAHGDIPLEPTAGKVIAELVVDHPGYYIIDLSGTTSNAEQDRFAADFAERLYRYKAGHTDPLHLFIDEADSFAPQRPMDGQQRMLGAFEALVRRGGIRGIGMTMITQRPAVLNKNVLTQAEVLIVLQMNAPQDQKAIDEWVQKNGTKEQRDLMMASLASLKKGEAWIWSPAWLEVFERVNIRERHTFNSSATPKAGEKIVAPKRLAPVDIEQLKDKIASTIERAKADDPKELKRTIATLQKKVQQLESAKPETKIDVQRVEVPVLSNDQITKLISWTDAMRATAQIASKSAETIATAIQNVKNHPVPSHATARNDKGHSFFPPSPLLPRSVSRSSASLTEAPISGELVRGQRAILQALARCHPMKLSLPQLGRLARQSLKSSSFKAYLADTKRAGLMAHDHDGYTLTDSGMAAIDFTPSLPQTSDERIAMWRNALIAGERAIFDYVLSASPRGEWVAQDNISAATGQSLKSSSFKAYLANLVRNRLFDKDTTFLRPAAWLTKAD